MSFPVEESNCTTPVELGIKVSDRAESTHLILRCTDTDVLFTAMYKPIITQHISRWNYMQSDYYVKGSKQASGRN